MTYPDWEQLKRDSFGGAYMRDPDLPMIDAQTPTFMARPLATTAGELAGADVVIIGAPYVAATDEYAGVPRADWIAGPQRVRQQSTRYRSGYIQDFDLDVFEHLNVVDYGDADCDVTVQTPENILAAQAAVEAKVNDALAVGAIPIVIGQNSPCGSFAIAKSVSEHIDGSAGMISLDTHWDAAEIDGLTGDPRIAGSASWKYKTYELLHNFTVPNLVEIGERGMLEPKERVRGFLERGARFYPMWAVRTKLGIDGLCDELRHAYDGTDGVYVHFDMDVIGGAGPAPGDILGELSEPIGMSDYEVIRIAHEIGRRGLTAMSFICIPPGSKSVYRLIVYIIAYLMAGLVEGRKA
jgi:agmatinase